MKKLFAILMTIGLLVSVAACTSNQKSPSISPVVNTPVQTEAKPMKAVSPLPVAEYNPNDLEDWNWSQAKDAEPKSDNPMAICNLFPDPYMAYDIAQIFNKKVNDAVTFEELAGYSGDLNCSCGRLQNIKGIGYMTGITAFSCCKNDLAEIPDEFGNLINLKVLNLTKAYSLEQVTSKIKNLTNLEEIRIGLTALKEVPEGIGALKKLKLLRMDNTAIVSIPDEIGELTSLEELDIHSNNIESVPDSICNLTNLKTLDISYTKLKSLPENIGSLKNLEYLNLFGDQLKTLPTSMKNLTNLLCLNVYDNYDLDEDYKNWYQKDVYE